MGVWRLVCLRELVWDCWCRAVARVAQLVEHTLGKGEVTGSIPVACSVVEVGRNVGGLLVFHGFRLMYAFAPVCGAS